MAATNTERFSEDLVTEILCHLPVKSIIRFRSLSRHYSTVCDSHSFISKHLNFSSLNNPSLLLRRDVHPPITNTGIALIDNRHEPNDVHTPFACDSRRTKIVGSCNGLVCISLSPVDDNLLAWNPATKHIRPIPPPLISRTSPPQGTQLSSVSIGFGFDRDVDNYVVVRIVYFRNEVTNQLIPRVEIFSRRLGFWREMNADDFTDLTLVEICERYPVGISNGVIYFEATGLSDPDDRQYIVSFDVHAETFSKTPMPKACYHPVFWFLFVCRETVTTFVGQWRRSGTRFELWMLDENGGGGGGGGGGEPWTILSSIGTFAFDTDPIGIWKGNEVVMQMEVIGDEGIADEEIGDDGRQMEGFGDDGRQMEGIGDNSLFLYNLDTHEMNDLRIVGSCFVYETHEYVESLVPV